MDLRQGDCLEILKDIKDKSIDFVFLDLPYQQTAMKWDKKIDLKELWKHLKRVARNERTPFFFTCTTKFGYELIKSNPKYFRWDLVWEKNRPVGFLNAYKLPMRKHEMIYCFAKKTPEYDVSSHTEYKEEKNPTPHNAEIYGLNKKTKGKRYKERLPTSVIPPQEDHELIYCFAKKTPEYDVSSHTNKGVIRDKKDIGTKTEDVYGMTKNIIGKVHKERLPTSVLPSSWCKIDLDVKTGHRTAKPVKLMEYLLKYWSKEGDTILDPTAGSGSMGIACKNMNRKFIGIELNEDIFELMKKRIDEA